MLEGGVKSPGRPFDPGKLILPIHHFWCDKFDIRDTFQKDLPDRLFAPDCHDQIREGWNVFDRRQHSEGFILNLAEDIRWNTIDQYEMIDPFGKEDRCGPGDPSAHRISNEGGFLDPCPVHETLQTINVGFWSVRNLGPVGETMTDQIEGINPVPSRENLDLLFPYPDPGAITMNQHQRAAHPFHCIKNRMAIDLNRPRRERRVPVEPSGSDERKASSSKNRGQ